MGRVLLAWRWFSNGMLYQEFSILCIVRGRNQSDKVICKCLYG